MQELKRSAISRLFSFRRPDGFIVFLVTLSVLSASLILLREATYGVWVSWDSMNYIAGANKLLTGNFLVAYPATTPPLFPILLTSANLFAVDPRDIAGPLNAAAFGLSVFVAGQWLRSRIESGFLIVWGCLAIMFSIPLTNAASIALTEVVFVLLTILALIEIDKFLNTSQRSSLVWAALYTALACMTRYAGIALIMTIVLLLVFQHNVKLFESVKRIAAYLLIAITPLGLWLLRNILITGTLTGNRRPSNAILLETLEQTNGVISKWVFLDLSLGGVQVVALILVGIALLALMIAAGYNLIRSYQDTEARNNYSPFYTFGTFTLVYISFIIMSQMTTHLAPPGNRFLSPVYIPLLFVAVFTMDRFIRYQQKRRLLPSVSNWPIIGTIVPTGVNILTVILAIVLTLWLYQAVLLNAAIIQKSNAGRYGGFASPKWSHSEVIRYIKAHHISGVVYSNVPPAIYFNVTAQEVLEFSWNLPASIYSDKKGLKCIKLPFKWHELTQRMEREHTTSDDEYIVWFYNWSPWASRYDYDFHEIGALSYMELVVELSDGVIFQVSKN